MHLFDDDVKNMMNLIIFVAFVSFSLAFKLVALHDKKSQQVFSQKLDTSSVLFQSEVRSTTTK